MVTGEGFEPPMFTTWVLGLQPSAFATTLPRHGNPDQIRTGVKGFAVPCLASRPPGYSLRRGSLGESNPGWQPCLDSIRKLPLNWGEAGCRSPRSEPQSNLLAEATSHFWWTTRESNPPHSACKAPSPPWNMPAHSILVGISSFSLAADI